MPSKAALIIVPQLFIGVECPFWGWWWKSLFRVDHSQPWKKPPSLLLVCVFLFLFLFCGGVVWFFFQDEDGFITATILLPFFKLKFKWSLKGAAQLILMEICCHFKNYNFFLLSNLGSLWCSFIMNTAVMLWYTHIVFESRNIHLGRCSWIVRRKVQTTVQTDYPTVWRLDLIITGMWIRILILEPYKVCCSRYLLSKAAALGSHCTETWLKVRTDSEINVLCCHLYSLIIKHGKKKTCIKFKLIWHSYIF